MIQGHTLVKQYFNESDEKYTESRYPATREAKYHGSSRWPLGYWRRRFPYAWMGHVLDWNICRYNQWNYGKIETWFGIVFTSNAILFWLRSVLIPTSGRSYNCHQIAINIHIKAVCKHCCKPKLISNIIGINRCMGLILYKLNELPKITWIAWVYNETKQPP